MADRERQYPNWRPSGSLDNLTRRAELLAQIRSFFARRQVLEMDVPVLGRAGVTDPNIDCLVANVNGQPRYLQSSPEYFLKRLLASGCGPVYCLGKAFRDGESGARHHPEFTLLEWYRPGWCEYQLMDEVEQLLAETATDPARASTRQSYRQAFSTALGVDPHTADLELLRAMAAGVAGAEREQWQAESRSNCLDLLFSLRVEPSLPAGLVQIYGYPACQAALAQIEPDETGMPVARRFEVFLDNMELGNGYYELTDVGEQEARFQTDIAYRLALGKPPMAADARLLAALEHGLPPCAGIALGVDRLLMQMLGVRNIAEVISFLD